ncbi:hypothetical protein TNCV_5020731 [Trichonephila clavipes]|nr:hypothetical protein TNCV_5020731 [Trichonephila clavipes]
MSVAIGGDLSVLFQTASSNGIRQVHILSDNLLVAAVAEWYRYRIVACHVTSSSPVPLKTRRVGQQCTLNLSKAETCPAVGVVW